MKGKQLYWNTWKQKTAIITLSVPLGAVIHRAERRYIMPESHSENAPMEPTTAVRVFASGSSTVSMTTYSSSYMGPVVGFPSETLEEIMLYLSSRG